MPSKLEVVNNCLLLLGETPLNELDEEHPMVPAALRELHNQNFLIQLPGWWFNTEQRRLVPDVTGAIVLPDSTLSVTIPSSDTYVQRGRNILDTSTGATTGLSSVDAQLVLQIEFEDLPPIAAAYIGISTEFRFCADYEADPTKIQVVARTLANAQADFRRQHEKAIKTNLLYTNTNARWRAALRGDAIRFR